MEEIRHVVQPWEEGWRLGAGDPQRHADQRFPAEVRPLEWPAVPGWRACPGR